MNTILPNVILQTLGSIVWSIYYNRLIIALSLSIHSFYVHRIESIRGSTITRLALVILPQHQTPPLITAHVCSIHAEIAEIPDRRSLTDLFEADRPLAYTPLRNTNDTKTTLKTTIHTTMWCKRRTITDIRFLITFDYANNWIFVILQ